MNIRDTINRNLAQLANGKNYSSRRYDLGRVLGDASIPELSVVALYAEAMNTWVAPFQRTQLNSSSKKAKARDERRMRAAIDFFGIDMMVFNRSLVQLNELVGMINSPYHKQRKTETKLDSFVREMTKILDDTFDFTDSSNIHLSIDSCKELLEMFDRVKECIDRNDADGVIPGWSLSSLDMPFSAYRRVFDDAIERVISQTEQLIASLQSVAVAPLTTGFSEPTQSFATRYDLSVVR